VFRCQPTSSDEVMGCAAAEGSGAMSRGRRKEVPNVRGVLKSRKLHTCLACHVQEQKGSEDHYFHRSATGRLVM
jgi:hypothetical protein